VLSCSALSGGRPELESKEILPPATVKFNTKHYSRTSNVSATSDYRLGSRARGSIQKAADELALLPPETGKPLDGAGKLVYYMYPQDAIGVAFTQPVFDILVVVIKFGQRHLKTVSALALPRCQRVETCNPATTKQRTKNHSLPGSSRAASEGV